VAEPELLLIRHAESTWNVELRWQGHEDPPLSPRGMAQAETLARALAGAPVARILSSDLLRARATAEPLARAFGVEVTLDRRLRELDVGRWGGRTRDEIRRSEPELLSRFDQGDRDTAAGGGESRSALRERALAALRALAAADATGCIAVVTHLGWLREVLPGEDFAHAECRRAPLAGVLRVARAGGVAA
jgi:probable phosphoglycerate mutase